MNIKMQINPGMTAALCGRCGQAFTPAAPAMITTTDNKPVCDRCTNPAMIEARDEINATPLPAHDPNFHGSGFMQDLARAANRMINIGDKIKQFNQNLEARYE